MIIKFVMKFLPTCLPSGLTVAAPDAFGRITGVKHAGPQTNSDHRVPPIIDRENWSVVSLLTTQRLTDGRLNNWQSRSLRKFACLGYYIIPWWWVYIRMGTKSSDPRYHKAREQADPYVFWNFPLKYIIFKCNKINSLSFYNFHHYQLN